VIKKLERKKFYGGKDEEKKRGNVQRERIIGEK
jgi:hypothetical protein